ncbi:MAG: hypothetical protein AAFX10_11090 [Pseudomonadota bacterium]
MPQRYVMLVLAFLTLTACGSTDPLSRQMSGWQQRSIDTAIAEWGDPEEQLAFGDQTILVWRDRPGTADTPFVLCERQLAVDAGGMITGWRWRGDSCPTLDVNSLQSHFANATPR